GPESERATLFRDRVATPVVHDLPAADPELHAAVALDEEGVGLRETRRDLASPTDREGARRNAGSRGTLAPFEVDRRVDAAQLQGVQLRVAEVVSAKPAGLCWRGTGVRG